MTEAFRLLVEGPTEISDEVMQLLERFTVLLYDHTSESNSVNEVRKHLFTAKGRTLQNIPQLYLLLNSTSNGQHCKGFVSGVMLKKYNCWMSHQIRGEGLASLESGSHYGPPPSC